MLVFPQFPKKRILSLCIMNFYNTQKLSLAHLLGVFEALKKCGEGGEKSVDSIR
jgi:hypothetical protein